MSASERICLVGWGAISRRVAQLLRERSSPASICSVAVREVNAGHADLPEGARLVCRPEELPETGATLVVEAAGRDSILPWGSAALGAGIDFAVSSTSAFAEGDVLATLLEIATSRNARILLPPGALGGIDALSAASRRALASVEHRIYKPARAWRGTEAEALCNLDSLTAQVEFYAGSAADVARAFPRNANVAVITALAGIGMDSTRVTLVADPHSRFNVHEIRATGDFGRLEIRIENRPLPTNPKSSEMTALGLVRLIENRINPLVI